MTKSELINNINHTKDKIEYYIEIDDLETARSLGGDLEEMEGDLRAIEEDEYDGQPTEYEEWQDYMGGDDWDHGQYDFGDDYY